MMTLQKKLISRAATFFAIVALILGSCETPTGGNSIDEAPFDENAIISIESLPFSSAIGDSEISISISPEDTNGLFDAAEKIGLEFFSITTPGTGGYANLSGGAVEYVNNRQIKISGLDAVNVAGSGQKITVAALAQATQIAEIIVVSISQADIVAADLFKTTHSQTLALLVSTVSLAHQIDINQAIAAYNDLTPGAKTLLTEEKALLDALQFKLTYLPTLALTTAAVTTTTIDEISILVTAALNAYNALSPEAKTLLLQEKIKLDALNRRIVALLAGVIKVDFTSSSYTDVLLSDLDHKNIFLVQMNKSSTQIVPETGIGIASSLNDSPSSGMNMPNRNTTPDVNNFGRVANSIFDTGNGAAIERREAPYLQEFAKNPIPAYQVRSAAQTNAQNNTSRSIGILQSNVDTSRNFQVQDQTGAWQTIPATLRSSNDKCDVWVANANFAQASDSSTDNKITSAQAELIADKFQAIYGYETPVFGYEYGGGPGGDGGVDGETRVQILVYDIDYDYAPTQTGGVLGFFSPLDEFDQATLNSMGYSAFKTNKAEMIYVDAHIADRFPSMIHSTLVHEFQHLINFNQKNVKLSGTNPGSAVWFNEMMSMLAEDLIDPMIGIPISDQGHPVQMRMPLNLANYDVFPAYGHWANSSPDVYYAYSNAYAFGAYLARNYGGPALVREIATNQYNDHTAITRALASVANPLRSSIDTIAKAFDHYGEAFVFSGANNPPSVMSFNKTVTDTTINPDVAYTYRAFNIKDILNALAGSGNFPSDYKGPYISHANQRQFSIAPQALLVQSLETWKDLSGSHTIRVTKPTNSNIDIYIMVADTQG